MEVKSKELLDKYRKGELSIKDIEEDPLGIFLMLPFISEQKTISDEEIAKHIKIVADPGFYQMLVAQYLKGPISFVQWVYKNASKDIRICVGLSLLCSLGLMTIKDNPTEVLKKLMRGK